MKTDRDSNLIVVFRGNPMESEMLMEMLMDNGIPAQVNNQLMGSIAPWHVSAGGFEPVEVIIQEKDRGKAMDLLKEFGKQI